MTSIQHSGGPGGQLGEMNGFENPGLPEHKPRINDSSPSAERLAERQIAAWFIV